MHEKTIFIGSDILTNTSSAMWDAMKHANLSWAKEGGDINVQRFIARITELTGQEDAIIVPTCGAANLVSLMTHVKPGGQIITDKHEHILWYEGNGIDSIAGIRAKLVDTPHGIMTAQQIADAADYSVCNQIPDNAAVFIENTHTIGGGIPYSEDETEKIAAEAHKRNMKLHVDGARIFNAAVSEKTDIKSLTRYADSVSISLNKILGVPFGAVLCGSKEFIKSSINNLKRISSFSLHKSGLIAAAAMTRLSEDEFPNFMNELSATHARTLNLARRLNEISDISVDIPNVRSNIFFMNVSETGMDSFTFIDKMRGKGVIGNFRSKELIRLVLSTDITDDDVNSIIKVVEQVVEKK